jgi:Family of unknown function (DUF6519)
MSTIDLSRIVTDSRKHYAGVRHQQGRVLSDEDFNEAAALDSEELRRTRLHTIGAYGAPDAGFLPTGFVAGAGGKLDFTLSAGELYLGGLRLEMTAPDKFLEQRDWINLDKSTAEFPNAPAAGTSRTDLVWLEAWQQPVTAIEDSELFEPALGGPDTTTRLRTMRRVHVLPGVSGDACPSVWASALASFASMGTIDAENRITTTAALRVSFSVAPGGDLCSPTVAGGYLGAENQAIRVQMVDATHYCWGFDNAAPLYRALVTSRAGSKIVVQLQTPPKDAAHWPLAGQVVELLPWSAILPNGQRIADLAGHLCKASVSYDPDTGIFEIDTALPTGFDHWKTRSDVSAIWNGTPEDEFVYVRVWNRGDDMASPAAIPIATSALGNTGLSISFSGGPLRPQDHWIIAARPADPMKVMPWRLSLPTGAPPIGFERFRAPLGLIRWTTSGAGVTTGVLIDDCRPPFLPLTRIRGCCTVTVGDGVESFGMFSSINAAILALPASGGEVCVLPGTYREAVKLDGRHSVTLHGCGPRSRIVAPDLEGADSTAIAISDSNAVTIERLALEGGNAAVVRIEHSEVIRLSDCLVQFRDERNSVSPWSAIFASGEDIEIEDNIIEPLPDNSAPYFHMTAAAAHSQIADAARGGIQLAGGCERVRIASNVITGGRGNGITLGSILKIDDDNPGGIVVIDIDIVDPCFPCQPTNIGIDGNGGDEKVHYESAGDLYDIDITKNIIARHSANGIAVVRFFTKTDDAFPMIVVHNLHITENRIDHCLWHVIQAPPEDMMNLLGYGGVSLAVVTNLAVTGNHIVNNGINWLDPVCGIFVLMATGLIIEHNIIRNNGPTDKETPENGRPGVRAGIHVWLALSIDVPSTKKGQSTTAVARGFRSSQGQLRIHSNQVEQPLGRALFMLGAGPMLITDNHFSSAALASKITDPFARTVLVANFGLSREWTWGLLFALVMLILKQMGTDLKDGLTCLITKLGAFTPGIEIEGMPTGKLAFHDNQVSFHMPEPTTGFDASSALLLSLDAVSAISNDFEYHVKAPLKRWALADLVAAGVTVQTSDNRLAETWGRAFFSIFSLGILNTAADNQSTHCLKIEGMRTARHDNLVLGEAFCEGICGDDFHQQANADLASGFNFMADSKV